MMLTMAVNAVQSGVYAQKTKEQALAAILAGWELGIGHREALDNFAAINGRLSPSSQLQFAQLLRTVPTFEHYWVELSGERAAMKCRRSAKVEWSAIEYTMKEAVLAGLNTKDTYRKHPVDMLANRCLGRVCAFMAPDAMGGASYSREVAETIPDRNPGVPITKEESIIDATDFEEIPSNAGE
jgi:hypothetical protein